jgi:hypothetical protein
MLERALGLRAPKLVGEARKRTAPRAMVHMPTIVFECDAHCADSHDFTGAGGILCKSSLLESAGSVQS